MFDHLLVGEAQDGDALTAEEESRNRAWRNCSRRDHTHRASPGAGAKPAIRLQTTNPPGLPPHESEGGWGGETAAPPSRYGARPLFQQPARGRATRSQAAMAQGGQAGAHALEVSALHIRQRYPLPLRALREHVAPRVSDETLAVGATTARVSPPLGRRHDVGL